MYPNPGTAMYPNPGTAMYATSHTPNPRLAMLQPPLCIPAIVLDHVCLTLAWPHSSPPYACHATVLDRCALPASTRCAALCVPPSRSSLQPPVPAGSPVSRPPSAGGFKQVCVHACVCVRGCMHVRACACVCVCVSEAHVRRPPLPPHTQAPPRFAIFPCVCSCTLASRLPFSALPCPAPPPRNLTPPHACAEPWC